MEPQHKVNVPLGHRLSVTEAVQYLVHHLDCDGWHVAAHREHLFVFHLTREERKRFAVCVECTAPVDKAIYHGSLASAISILPLGPEPDLASSRLQELKEGLLQLATTTQEA